MTQPEITSPNNARIKQIRDLMARRRARLQTRRCALEGARLVTDALEAGAQVDYVLFTPGFAAGELGAALLVHARALGVTTTPVAPNLTALLSGTETPQGVWAVCRLPELPAPARPTLALLLDQIRDPGNLGTILRTAGAAGVEQVILTKGTADPFNPKALRAGMGAHFRVPVAFADEAGLPGAPLALADARGAIRYDAFDWTQPVTLAVGGEAEGFSEDIRRRAAAVVSIPMARATESLNAAAAAAVILFEARRQRART
ncbi:MAG: RNA methyltransferase [Anaerolineae bacterium]|nr:RNA methyltransferase [Anaerolineae bacterium]